MEYIRKRGIHGFVYDLTDPSTSNGNFALSNTRQDHYDGFQISGRHAFRNGHMVAASYVRSRTRSNQVLDFNIDNPQFSPQQPGPYPWDTPNRFFSYGLLPLVKGFDLAYSTEVRTGVPSTSSTISSSCRAPGLTPLPHVVHAEHTRRKAIPRPRLLLGHPWRLQQRHRPQKLDRRQQ